MAVDGFVYSGPVGMITYNNQAFFCPLCGLKLQWFSDCFCCIDHGWFRIAVSVEPNRRIFVEVTSRT